MDFYHLYDVLIENMTSEAVVADSLSGSCWTAVEAEAGFGMAMTTDGDTRPPMIPAPYSGLPLKTLAQAAKSWNFAEAGYGLAAVNAFYNTPEQLDALGAYAPFEQYCTHGLDLTGKRLGVVGHLNMPEDVKQAAAEVCILERDPRPGDYPDSACDWLLPQCDVVILTASTLVNKTLPHLLEVCRNSYTILAGPSCPMCPELLELGLDRIAGLVITQREAMKDKIRRDLSGPPYPLGKPFLLTSDR